jgi:hypothetical protein
MRVEKSGERSEWRMAEEVCCCGWWLNCCGAHGLRGARERERRAGAA